ncbi:MULTISPECIES: hypothetical protein [unclassified Vibrio]|uniref:hypothetical protein n=1 Tax=unclassified Vibrio TaxID=2614977 RepID=UPI0012AA29EC|nr:MULTISPECIES: hypothetical protein [unclassified Vibrio]QFT37633.1 hypothetical protein FIU99_14525 [Vibrio sp. THAF64]QGM35535.1 hypothetical protein GGC04_14530 [Vibrio sp. THAF191d]QGN71036.1 hypothetical protein GGC03_14530 [Vibrio sp. THAF191c]
MEIEQLESIEEVHREVEEKALLAELDGEDFDPSTVTAKVDADAAKLAAGEASAMMALGVTEQLLKQFAHQDFTFDEEQAKGVASAAAPLFVKYGGELPPWLAAYKEEFAFVVAAGALSFTSFSQIKALKAMDEEKEINPEEEQAEEV